MNLYRHILAAIELDDSGEQLLVRARDLAQALGAKLSIVHIVEYIALDSGEALLATPVDLNRQLLEGAQKRMNSLCAKLGIPTDSARVVNGPVPLAILDMAATEGIDLIAVGHRARRGFLSSWFSHTEENVVSKAPCDVLALTLAAAA